MFQSAFVDGEKNKLKTSLQVILGIDYARGGCRLRMGTTMVWFPTLETAENNEFLKSVNFWGTFLGTQNGPKTVFFKVPRSQDQFQPVCHSRFVRKKIFSELWGPPGA